MIRLREVGHALSAGGGVVRLDAAPKGPVGESVGEPVREPAPFGRTQPTMSEPAKK